jgi:hypothetical protein
MDKGNNELGLSPTPGASKLTTWRPRSACAKGAHESSGRVKPLISSNGSPSPSTWTLIRYPCAETPRETIE